MSRTRVLILALVLTLLASNAWWAYHAVDSAVTASHRYTTLREHREALAQALAVLPVASRPGATRTQILDAARGAAPSLEPFEKDGLTWIGQLGFRFPDDGTLLDVRPAWEPF